MNANNMSNDPCDNDCNLEQKLALLNSLTRDEFDQAEKLINTKLQAALDSLEQSATAVRMLLAAQSPADLASASGVAVRKDLESLLASSTHLSRLASLMQQGFSSGREASEKRTEQETRDLARTLSVDARDRHVTRIPAVPRTGRFVSA